MVDQDSSPKLNANRASAEELQELPGLGPALVDRIIAARPYQELEDLRQVSGVGDRLLERLRPHLELGPFEAEEPVEKEESAPKRVQRRSRKLASAPGISRGSALAMDLLIGLFSALIGAGLTLGVLLAINGTLNMGRHAQVRQLNRSVADLERDLAQLENEIAGVDQRLSALEGLTGRMNEVEGEVSRLRREMDGALQTVQSMREAVAGLQETTDSLTARVERFDHFLNGLRQLLDSAPIDGPEETPTP